ncbi:hotdog fold thioesterase [Arthrobacter sp. NPDC092385]|uniref:hotdog fold thioesterase n=1 Tax=Arthrobacter sp. NPDC092385 TaxID=3363943 RepID=UPI00380235E4
MLHPHPILANDRASRWLGIEVDRALFGDAQISMTVREEMVNGFGIAHGGIIFAFADTCFALACNDPDAGPATGPDAGPDAGPATITVASGADINFVAPAFQGQTLTAVGRVVNRTGRSGIYDIRVTAGSTLIAEFRGRSRTIPNPVPR